MRIEQWKCKKKNSQKQFYEFISKSDTYSKCFNSQDESVSTQFNRWQRKANRAIYACLRKIWIQGDNNRKPSKIDELMDKRKTFLKKKSTVQQDEMEVDKIENNICLRKLLIKSLINFKTLLELWIKIMMEMEIYKIR